MKYLLYLSLFISNIAISGTIYQCKDSHGKSNFQDKPCVTSDATIKETKTNGVSNASGTGHSMWVEPNYVDTQHSVLFESLEVSKAKSDDEIFRHIPFGWMPYYVKARVVDVYKGNLNKNDIVDLLIYLTAKYQVENISQDFILSFCISKGEIYYTSRNFLTQKASRGNIMKFEDVREHGTDYEGTGDCAGNYPELNPDTHN